MQVEDIRPEGWACTYLVANVGKAVLIDPVWDYISHYEAVLQNQELELVACMATHTHADHIQHVSLYPNNTTFHFTCGRIQHLWALPIMLMKPQF